VRLHLVRTPKNEPALAFADAVVGAYRREVDDGVVWDVPADVAAAIVHRAGEDAPEVIAARKADAAKAPKAAAPALRGRSARYARLATELTSGPAVMRAQLERLVEVSKLRHVTIQVVPFNRGGHAAAGGSFTVLRFSEPEVPDVVYIEQLTSALYLDKREDVDHYLEVMNHLSTEALTPTQSAKFITEIIRDT